MKCAVVAAVSTSAAFAAQLHTNSAFLNRERDVSFNGLTFDGPDHNEAWYKDECDSINNKCEERKEAIRRKYEEDLAYLKAQWLKNKGILDEKQSKHKAEKEDVVQQSKVVAEETKDVKEAKVAVKEKAHCPADLESAKNRLAELEAKPDKLPKDVDEECELRKKILHLERCVTELRAAEAVLSKEKDEYRSENRDLADENSEENKAAGEVPPQERETAAAKEAYESFKARGVRGINKVEEECQTDRDALERQADDDVRSVEEELRKQRQALTDKTATHKDEQADVVDQKKAVVQEQKDVAEAKKEVAEYDHCPAELESAEARLSELQAIPNKSPKDVDEECEIKKKILELKDCVAKLRAAEAVLKKEAGQYHTENKELSEEAAQEREAASAVPPVKSMVADLERMLAGAKSARAAICPNPNARSPAPAPAPEKPKKEAPKSGAARSAGTVLAVVAVMFSGLLRA